MRSLRVLALFLLIAGAVIAAGCGAQDGSAPAAPTVGSAEVVPASAHLYLSLNSDLDSEQWQTAETLLERLPSGRELLDEALAELAPDGLELEADVGSALGPELVVAGLAAPTEGAEAVVLTQPRDEARFDELITEGDERLAVREIDGWKALAETEDVLDRFEEALAEGSLAGSEDFEAVIEKLSGTGLATFFTSGANLLEATALEGTVGESIQGLTEAIGSGGAFGGEVIAESEGLRLTGLARASGVPETLSYESRLVELAPAETALFVSFNDVDGILSELLDALGESNPDLDQQLGLLEVGLGISITDDLLPLFQNEGAALLLPGQTESSLALMLEVDDVDRVLETIDSVSSAIAAFTPDAEPGATTTIDGVEVREFAIDGDITFSYAGFDGLLVFASSPEAISILRTSGQKLGSDPKFLAVLETTAMPDETNGFAYVNFDEAIPALEGLKLGGAREKRLSDGLDGLSALDWALLYGTREGDDFPFAGFVKVS